MGIFSYVKLGKKIFGKQKTIGEVKKDFVGVAKNLKNKRDFQDDVIKTRERVLTEYGVTKPEVRRDIRKTANQPKINKKAAEIYDKKAKGGRVGLKFGTKKKSNVDKIKKTFGPKSLGMQSVIYGLDKNKNVTKADPKAKFIAAAKNKKKKVI